MIRVPADRVSIARAVSFPPGLLRPIRHNDREALVTLAKHLAGVPGIWDDRVFLQEGGGALYFMSVYGNPDNIVLDVANGGGVIAVNKIYPGWRGQGIIALWSRRAHVLNHRYNLVREAARAAMLHKDLLVIDSFVARSNKRARRLCERVGMRLRGYIRQCMCYNGRVEDAAWYEYTRQDVGLPD